MNIEMVWNTEDGSSRKMISGFPMKAKATATFLLSPPLRYLTYLSLNSIIFKSINNSLIYFFLASLSISKNIKLNQNQITPKLSKNIQMLINSKLFIKNSMLWANSNFLSDLHHVGTNIITKHENISWSWFKHSNQHVQGGCFTSSIVS